MYNYIDSLSAFWSGSQVLAGDVEAAIKSHLFYWNLWKKYSAMPEAFNFINRTSEWNGYPLRPEFVESTYYLYRATKDTFYLDVGARILRDLRKRTKVRCGFAVIHDIISGKLEDRMESFMLSETLKYLYLLFQEVDPVHDAVASGHLFTTEGHLLRLPTKLRKAPSHDFQEARKHDFAGANYVCQPYEPFSWGGLHVGIRQRDDYDYAASLVDMPLVAEAEKQWDSDQICKLPLAGPYHFEISFSAEETEPHSPKTPDLLKRLVRKDGDLIVHDVQDVKARLTRTPDDKGFRVTSIGPVRVRPGQAVILTDPTVLDRLKQSPHPPPSQEQEQQISQQEQAQRILHEAFQQAIRPSQVILEAWTKEGKKETVLLEGVASTGLFGKPMLVSLGETPVDPLDGQPRIAIAINTSTDALPLVRPLDEGACGCHGSFYPPSPPSPFVALIRRGGCTFYEKLLVATGHGASGVLVTGSDEQSIRPSAEGDPVDLLQETGILYVVGSIGEIIHTKVDQGEDVFLSLKPLHDSQQYSTPDGGPLTAEDLADLLGGLSQLEDEHRQEEDARVADQLWDADGDATYGSRVGPPVFLMAGLPIVNLYMEPMH